MATRYSANMKKFFLLTFATLFLVMGAVPVSAQPQGPGGGGSTGTGGGGETSQPLNAGITLENPFEVGDTLYEVAQAIVEDILLPIGGVLCVLAFIYSGFMYVTAGGDKGKIATAHKSLLYTSIGTAVLLGAWVIATVIENTINALI